MFPPKLLFKAIFFASQNTEPGIAPAFFGALFASDDISKKGMEVFT
jgi:hypothetical protein